MVHILGYSSVSATPAVFDALLDALARLDHCGYDGVGVGAVNPAGAFSVLKMAGRVSDLRRRVDRDMAMASNTGLAHLRWATRGEVSDENAHPQVRHGGSTR